MCVSLCVWCARECKKKHQQRNINKQKKERRERDRRERAREKEREKDERRSNEKKKKKKKELTLLPPSLSPPCSLLVARERQSKLAPEPFFCFKARGALFLFFLLHASTRGSSSLREPADRVEEREETRRRSRGEPRGAIAAAVFVLSFIVAVSSFFLPLAA